MSVEIFHPQNITVLRQMIDDRSTATLNNVINCAMTASEVGERPEEALDH